MEQQLHLLIGGELVDGDDTVDARNPATGAPFTIVARASVRQLESAVAAAGRAFPTWRDIPVTERNACVRALAEAIGARRDERAYAIAEGMETGTVWINHHLHLHPAVPVGGAKESGTGVDYGVEGLKQYTRETRVRRAL